MKPGATTSPFASMVRFALPVRHAADRDDPVAADRDIAVEPRVAGAVDDAAVADDEVVLRLRGRGKDRKKHKSREGEGESHDGPSMCRFGEASCGFQYCLRLPACCLPPISLRSTRCLLTLFFPRITMTLPNRRAFLGTSFAGLTAAVTGHSRIAPGAPPVAPAPRAIEPVPTTLAPQDTMFLTWQRDPTTTMTIQWVGPQAATETTIRYVPRLGTTWKSAKVAVTSSFPKTDFKVHRCEMTGSYAGYRIPVPARQEFANIQVPHDAREGDRGLQFVSGGDCGVNPHAVANNILAAKQEPHFALIGGDLGYDNGSSAGTAIGFLPNYAKHMIDPKGRLIPLVTCLGNHEVIGGYKRKREDATFYLPLFDGLYKETTYGTLDFGDYLSLVLLDTGHISPDRGRSGRLARRRAEGTARPAAPVRGEPRAGYPSYRSPDTASRGKFGTGEAQRLHWCPLFEKYRVDAVLEHHDHTFKRTHPLDRRAEGQVRRPVPGRRLLGSVANARNTRRSGLTSPRSARPTT